MRRIDYPGCALGSVVAAALGLPGIDPATSLACQHKYHSRLIQRAAVPESTAAFELIAGDGHDPQPAFGFPCFVKPVKSFFSVGAQRVDSAAAFGAAVRA